MAQVDARKKMLGEMLAEAGLVQENQLRKALEEQKKRGGRLGEILVELRMLSERDLALFLGKQLDIPFVELENHLVESDAAKLVPAELARRLTAVPLSMDDEGLIVALADPLDIFGLDDIRRAAGMDIRQVVSTRSGILNAIDRAYALSSSSDADTRGLSGSPTVEKIDLEEDGDAADVASEDSPVVKLVNMLIAQAIREKASDIHVHPEGDMIKVRYRIDGVLREVRSFSRDMHAPIVSRVKILANMNIAERRIPQDGRFQVQVTASDEGQVVRAISREGKALRMTGDTSVDVRVSTLPVIQGEAVAMRILNRDQIITDLENLGMNIDMLDRFRKTLTRPYGMVLVAGPTGSGMTTTLYASLSAIDRKTHNVVTIEDPVEYQIDDVKQLQVDHNTGVTFASGLRSILRQDPDIIMVGEIRDLETAKLAIDAALTGHLVFSTLHTNNAAAAIGRLVDMGIEPFLVASAVTSIVSQRLVRKVCDHCKKTYYAPTDLLKRFGMPPGLVMLYRGEGCPICTGTGYQGRIGLFEIMEVSDKIRSLITSRAPAAAIQAAAVQAGFKTIRQEGLRKAVDGITSVEEVLRVTQETDIP